MTPLIGQRNPSEWCYSEISSLVNIENYFSKSKEQIYLAKILGILKVDKRIIEKCLITFNSFYKFLSTQKT